MIVPKLDPWLETICEHALGGVQNGRPFEKNQNGYNSVTASCVFVSCSRKRAQKELSGSCCLRNIVRLKIERFSELIDSFN